MRPLIVNVKDYRIFILKPKYKINSAINLSIKIKYEISWLDVETTALR